MKQSNKVHWIGIDVAKDSFDAALALSDQRFPSTPLRDLPWKSFARTKAGTHELLKWIDDSIPEKQSKDVRVVMEATGNYSVELAAWLIKDRHEYAPAIENPAQIKAFITSLAQRNKTDGLDARALAFYGVERRPAPYEPLSPERQELRALTRHRDTLVRDRASLKNRMKETNPSRLVRTMRKRQLKRFDHDIEKLETEIKQLISNTSHFREDFKLLISVPGVGFITAVTMLAELGDMRRFQRARQLSAFAGISPRIYQSGTSVRGKTHLCKKGNGRVRKALFLSSMAVLRTKYDNHLKSTHKRLCLEGGKSGKEAIGAIMRKQLVLMRAILISGKPYDPLWKTQRQVSMAMTN